MVKTLRIMKDTGEDFFNSFFGGILSDFRVGDRVSAQLDPITSVRGILKSLPTVINGFCTVDGTITKSGVSTMSSTILVPKNLLKRNA